MTLRRVDARFLLPHPVRRAAVLAGVDGWPEGLERAGVEVAAGGGGSLDLVVAPPERAEEARSLAARAVILEGKRPPRRHWPGLEPRTYVPLPGPADPIVFVPLGDPGPARYAVEQWAFAGGSWKRLRNRLVGILAGRAQLPGVRPELLVATGAGRPFVVAAAQEAGLPAGARSLLLAGQGDDYSRAAFLLFEQGAHEPSWALKFARLPVRLASFEHEARGLELARSAGGTVAEHAPQWLGVFESRGLQCTLETAACGRPLLAVLRAAPDRAESRRAVDRVCEWLLEVARTTRAAPDALREERVRLAEQVVPRWGLDPALVDELPELPAVLQHNDLGCWNVVVRRDSFTALDWENAVRHGLPLWDLLYFLADAAAHLDRALAPAERSAHFERLFAGEAPSSPLLFRWTRALVDALELPPEAVGPVATLCWLQHGLSGEERRRASTEDPRPNVEVARGFLKEAAERWLRHPGLGQGWAAWR